MNGAVIAGNGQVKSNGLAVDFLTRNSQVAVSNRLPFG